MKKIVNGVLTDMTPEEIAEFERIAAEMPMPETNPEDEWKLMVEAALIELAAMMAGGGA